MSETGEPPASEQPGESGRHGLDELIAERRAKAERLRREDPSAFPYSFAGAEPIAEILPLYERLAPGDETDERHRVAGRIAARRGAGKAAFLDLVDRTGKIQLHARVDVLGPERFELLTALDLGDLIGVDGSAIRSRHGEVSLRVESFQILAKALRPPPDKHHGLADVETRYRHRELDLIASEDARRLFVDRARIISAVRRYLDANGFVEVETPVLQPLYGGAHGAPVHDPPQRARPRPLPADRHRAVPQAPDRRRARARVRAGQGLPQRGRLAQAQPRVHDGRVVRGVRRLRRRGRTVGGDRRAGRRRGRLLRRDRLLLAVGRVSASWRRSSSRRAST